MSLNRSVVFTTSGALMSVGLATSVATLLASTARADFTTSRYTSGTNYELVMSHMPDFDQQRDGLAADSAGTPGANFCVPTSCANLFAYIANHGFASVDPGAANWESSSNYTAGTDFIEQLGLQMGTSGTLGTSSAVAAVAVALRLNAEAPGRFVVGYEAWSASNVVSLKEMTKQSIEDDAIQSFCYGKYDVLGTNGLGEQVIWRVGGHCMTFTGAMRSGTTREITYADPSNSSSTSSQSAFTYSTVDCPWVEDLVVFPMVFGSEVGVKQSMNRIMRSTSDDYLRFLDSRISIRPASGRSWGSFDDGLVQNLALRTTSCSYTPGELASRNAPFVLPEGALFSMAISPSGVPFALVRSATGSQLFVEVRTAQGQSLVPFALPNLSLPPIDAIAFCGDRTLALLCGRQLFAISGLDSGLPDADEAAPQIAWQKLLPFNGVRMIPAIGASLHDGVQAVHVFSPDMRSIHTVSGDPEATPSTRTIPQSVQLDPQRLADTTVTEDSHGTVWYLQRGDSHVTAVTDTGNSFVVQLPLEGISDLAIDDNDNLLAVEFGVVRCFSKGQRGFTETGLAASPFAGLVVGKDFTVDRRSSNFEPRFHSNPGWNSVPDPEVTVRPGDLDGNNAVDGADMAALLSAWGSVNSNADLDHNGLVGASDLAVLLSNWGSGQ